MVMLYVVVAMMMMTIKFLARIKKLGAQNEQL